MTNAISETLSFFKENKLKVILARIRERNVPALVQFGVYGLCGGLATFAYSSILFTLSKTLIPAYEGMTVHGHLITDKERAYYFFINSCIAFAIANVVGYVTNVMFVFKSGRHHRVLEFFYFTFFNLISFGISQIVGKQMIKGYGMPTNVTILITVLTAVMLNFVLRKFFVFKG